MTQQSLPQQTLRMKRTTPSPSKQKRLQAAVLHIEAVKAERCRRSLFYFMKEFWSEVSSQEFIPNWHIEKVLCPELEKLARRVAQNLPKEHDLIINVPPGTTKTITCTIMFPVWCWINWYWMRFITGSYSGALSLESSEYSRDLVRSDKFRLYFPDIQIKDDKDTKSNFRVVKIDKNGKTLLGGNRYSTSVGGTVTGFHAHILIVDDPLNPSQAVSEVELRKANRWVDQTLSTRKVDKAVTPTVLVMQRLHQNDPSGHLLSKKKTNIKHICLPGEIRNYRQEVNPPELVNYYVDDLLDPNRMSWDVLKDMEKDLGQYGYSGQIGQKPTPPGGGMFKVDNLQVIDSVPHESQIIQVVRYWDKAGTHQGGAYTVGCKMASLKGGKFLVLDVKRGQWATEERERIIRKTAEADGVDVQIYMEQEPGSGGKDSIHSSISNLAGFSVYADKPVGDKVFRADPFSVQVNEGNVWLLRAEWNYDYIDELRHFPFSTYKDQVDASSGAFSKLVRKKQAGMLFSKNGGR